MTFIDASAFVMQKVQELTEKLHRAIQVEKLDVAKSLVQDGANMDKVLGK